MFPLAIIDIVTLSLFLVLLGFLWVMGKHLDSRVEEFFFFVLVGTGIGTWGLSLALSICELAR